MDSEISSFLQESQGVVELLAEQSVVKNVDEEQIVKILKTVANAYDQFQSLYLGTAEGEMIIVPDQELPSDFDPRETLVSKCRKK